MQVQIATCERCGHQWIMRVAKPIKCPKCGHIIGASIRIKKAVVPKVRGPDTTAPKPNSRRGEPKDG